MPDTLNWVSRSEGEALSEFTRRMVTTFEKISGMFCTYQVVYSPSFGLPSSQVLTSSSQLLKDPASSRPQAVWHRSHDELFLCTCAVRSRTPASSCAVVLISLVKCKCYSKSFSLDTAVLVSRIRISIHSIPQEWTVVGTKVRNL